MGTIQRSLVLARDVRLASVASTLPSDVTPRALQNTGQDGYDALGRFCVADGFPAGWAKKMLTQGREAHVLLDDQGEVVASAWIGRGACYISEIRRTFDTGPDADYYFGDFVAPPHRGRKLHRALIEMRLAATRAAGRTWAVGMTHATNLPSVAGYRSAGFGEVATLGVRTVGRWRIDSVRWTKPCPIAARFSTEGWPLPGIGRLRRR